MARSRFVIFALALLMSLSPVAASAHHDRPDRIDLPDGWMPEGITTDGRFLYSGSLADGALLRANPRTGNTRIIEEGRQGRVAVGVDYDRRRDLLWVAGGETGIVRAQDADTGRVVAALGPGSRSPSPSRTTRSSWLNESVAYTARRVTTRSLMNRGVSDGKLYTASRLPVSAS